MVGNLPMNKPQSRVEFTQRQLEWLDQQFPEVKATGLWTAEEMRWALARRSVIHELRDRLQKQE
jgi:hypothetical protein